MSLEKLRGVYQKITAPLRNQPLMTQGSGSIAAIFTGFAILEERVNAFDNSPLAFIKYALGLFAVMLSIIAIGYSRQAENYININHFNGELKCFRKRISAYENQEALSPADKEELYKLKGLAQVYASCLEGKIKA